MKQTLNKNALLVIVAMTLLLALMAACAPRQDGERPSTGDTGQDTAVDLPTWTMESDCAGCHVTEAASATNSACPYSAHASQGLTCTTCHVDDGGKLSRAHEKYATANLPKKLKSTAVSASSCLSCHNEDDLKAKTAGSTVLTDKDGTAANPHDLAQNTSHTENLSCSSCHGMHSSESLADEARNTCLGCHHADVYECGTCHE
jgi:hypothetical protein